MLNSWTFSFAIPWIMWIGLDKCIAQTCAESYIGCLVDQIVLYKQLRRSLIII